MPTNKQNENPKATDSAPLPSLTEAELTQVIGGIGRPSVYTKLRGRRSAG